MSKPIIINYRDTASLFDLKIIPYAGPVITATQAMAQAFRRCSDVLEPIMEMNILIQRLMETWKAPGLKLEQSLLLGDILDTFLENHAEEKRFRAFRRNQSEILKSFLVLTEAGVSASALPEATVEAESFKLMYHEFVESSASGVSEVQELWQSWQKPEKFLNDLKTALHTPRVQAVYLQGFYYMTPLQDRIIEAICRLNIPVYFLNNLEENESGAIWLNNPRFQHLESYRLPEKKAAPSWKAEFFEGGGSRKPAENTIGIIEFKDTFSLVRCIMDKERGRTAFYSPMSKDLKDIFEAFFPATDDKRHLLSYPVGQYLMSLYEMWDTEEGILSFKPELLRKCVASGWAGETFQSDHDLLTVYDKLAIYFEDCLTLKEWHDRAEKLMAVYQEVIPHFTSEGDFFREQMEQPLKLYAPFSCNTEDVKRVLAMLERITDDAVLLFKGSRRIRLEEHFKALSKLLEGKSRGALLLSSEQKVVQDLLKRLAMRPSRIKTCSARQLSEAMHFFLGGELDMLEETGDEAGWAQDTVRGLSDIEAARFLHPDCEIMLCCCDAQHLPGQPKPYSWPLSSEMLRSLTGLEPETANRIDDYCYYMDTTRMSDRYLFSLAMHQPALNLSWVSQHQGKVLASSPYLTILSDIYGQEIKVWSDNMLSKHGQTVEKTVPEFSMPRLDQTAFDGGNLPAEAEWNEDWCPNALWRDLYDFILGAQPSYQDRFSVDFYLTALITVLSRLTGETVDSTAKYVFEIVPVLDQAERSEVLGFASRAYNKVLPEQNDKKKFEGKIYQAARLYLKYLPVSSAHDYLTGKTSPKDDKGCMLCPHKLYCRRRVME